MNREHILTILYDITSTLSGEVHVEPLLTKMLQRLMFHSGCSAAVVLLNVPTEQMQIASVVGDAELAMHVGDSIAVSDGCLRWDSHYEESVEPLSFLPCRKECYKAFHCLDIPEQGKVLLLYRYLDENRLLLEKVLNPVMGNFAKQIDLCQLNDDQQKYLESLVASRTRELGQQKEMLSMLLESMAEGMYGIDLEGRFTFVNRAFLQMLGYERDDELLGRSSHEVMHHSHADGTPYDIEACRIYRSCQTGEGISCDDEVFWRKDKSSFPVEYHSFPIIDHGELKGAVITFRDVREEREQKEKLEHMQRLESLGLLAGGIAHDFNNILTAVMGNAALASARVDDTSPAKDFLKRIEDSSHRAADLCKQMLAYSGKGKFVVKPINLSEMVKQMARLMEVSIDKNVVIKYYMADNLPAVEVDTAQLQQVILNLITNANEAMQGVSGVISFSTGLMHADAAYLQSSMTQDTLPEGRYVFLEVSDTGIGMDEATQKKMFDPFFTTKLSGRGLGMSAVLGIVRGHKGAIHCYSEPGKGTSFKVLFPAVDMQAEPIVEQSGSAADAWRGEGTILIVDDEESICETAAIMLEDIGFQTISACDGIEAIELLKKHGDTIVAVLLDMTMPRMDGVECFSQMRRLQPGIRVMLSSGYNEQEATSRFAGKGLAGFIQKPYSPDQLAEKMKELLARG